MSDNRELLESVYRSFNTMPYLGGRVNHVNDITQAKDEELLTAILKTLKNLKEVLDFVSEENQKDEKELLKYRRMFETFKEFSKMINTGN